MKLNMVLKGLLTLLLIVGLSTAYGVSSQVTEAQGSDFDTLSVGDYVSLQKTDGSWETFRIFNVPSKRLLYEGSIPDQLWDEATPAAEAWVGAFPNTVVSTGTPMLTLDEIITVTGATYTNGVSGVVYTPDPSRAATLVLKGFAPYWTATSSEVNLAWAVDSDGTIEEKPMTSAYGVRPAVTVQDGLEISGGSGTNVDPYKLRPTSNDVPSRPSNFSPASNAWVNSGRPDISFTVTDPNNDLLSAYQWAITDAPSSNPGNLPYQQVPGEWASGTEINITPATPLSDGTHYLYVRVKDRWDAWGLWAEHSFKVDATAPGVPAISLSATEWTKDPVTVTIADGTENGSGVDKTEYTLDDGATWTTYTGPFQVTKSGTHTIEARTTDKAGNVGSDSSKEVRIDTTPPTAPTLAKSPAGEWTNAAAVSVTITDGTDDQSGYDKTEYSRDGNAWYPYDPANPIEVTATGVTTIQARGTDKAGNAATSTIQVQIDRTKPSSPTVTVSTYGWSAAAPTFTIGGSDEGGSGIAKYLYSFDGTNWQDYPGSAVTIDREGETSIYAKAVDNAGNESDISTPAVAQWDKTPPNKPMITPSTTTWANQVTFTLSGQGDLPEGSNSGVAKLQYRFDPNVPWQDYTPADQSVGIAIPSEIGEGLINIYARAVDGAGNEGGTETKVVKIDRTPPTAPTINAPNGWTNQTAFSITPGTDGMDENTSSGVNKTQYRFLTGTVGVWTDLSAEGQITLPSGHEGAITIEAKSIDKAGNESQVVSHTMNIDVTKPTAPAISLSPDTWTNGDVTVTITPGEDTQGYGKSGVKEVIYSTDGGQNWSSYSAPFTISAEGKREILAKTVDNAGNESDPVNHSVQIDRTAPSAPILSADGYISDIWTRENVTVTLTDGADQADLSGVAKSQYKIGDGDWTDYDPSGSGILFDQEGSFDLYARTLDNAGNVSVEAGPFTVKIDKTQPTAPAINLPAGWQKGPGTFTITPGTDAGSGVDRTEYKIGESGTWTLYSGGDLSADLLADTEGTLTLYARTYDKASNVTESSADIQIDNKAPASPTVTSAVYDGAWTNQSPVKLTVTGGTDGGSGTQKTEYRVNGGNWISFAGAGGTIQVEAADTVNGVAEIKVRSVDNVGNQSEEAGYTVKIDTAAPAAPTLSAGSYTSGTWTRENVTVTLTDGADQADLSGVAKSQYKIGSGAWTDYDPSGGGILFDEEGSFDIYARTLDKAGNVSGEAGPFTVKIDRTAPQPAQVTSSVYGWTNQAESVMVQITPGADGESGTQSVKYTIGSGQEQTVVGSNAFTVPVNEEGETQVRVITVDKVGNESAPVTYSVQIDRTAPSAPTLSAGSYTSGTWTKDDVTVTLTDGADQAGLSGVAKSQYKIGSGAWTDYDPSGGGILFDEEGSFDIYARTLDKAGNVSGEAGPLTVKIDKTAPEAPVITAPAGWSSGTVEVSLTPGTDPIGETDQLHFRTKEGEGDWSNWAAYDDAAKIHIAASGTTLIEAKAFDLAGNESEVGAAIVRIDTPGEAALLNGSDFNGTTTLDNSGTSYGPESGLATHTGNLTIAGDGITLRNVKIVGSLTVTGENAVLTNVTVTGDLTIDEQVDQDFTAINVTVTRKVVVNGGAPDTVTFTDSVLNEMEVNKANLHLLFDGSTSLTGTIQVNKASLLTFNTTGSINKIMVNASGVTLEGTKGTIQELAVAQGINMPTIQGTLTIVKKPTPSDPGDGGNPGGGGSGGGGTGGGGTGGGGTGGGGTGGGGTGGGSGGGGTGGGIGGGGTGGGIGGGGGSGGTGTTDPNVDQTVQQTIENGNQATLSLLDELTIGIAKGTFDRTVQIIIDKLKTFQPLPAEEKLLLVSPVYHVTADPDLPLKNPAHLTILFDQSKAADRTVALYAFDENQKVWVKMDGVAKAGSISAEVNSLGYFAVFAEAKKETGPKEVPTFTDISSHWAEAIILEGVSKGFINGYPNHTFQPDRTLTRAEFAVMIGKALGLSGAAGNLPFLDNRSIPDWAGDYVAGAVEKGIITGYEDLTFRPSERITRVQMAAMIARALELNGTVSTLAFTDADQIPAWGKASVAAMVENGLMQGRGEGRFEPEAYTTRAEATTVILKALALLVK